MRNFQAGMKIKINICGAHLSMPLDSQLTLHICAATNRLGGGPQTDFVPGRGKP